MMQLIPTKKVNLDRRLFWCLRSNFQGVIITPLVGANLTPNSGFFFRGVILTPKRVKTTHVRNKVTPFRSDFNSRLGVKRTLFQG